MNQNNPAQGSNDYLKACSSTRWAKNLFILVILLALLVHLGTYVVVGHTDLLKPPKDPNSSKMDTIRQIVKVIEISQPLAKSLGLVAAVLLVITMKFAANLSLADRLGGAGGFVSGFFWSLILLAGFIPWQHFESVDMIYGCIPTLEELGKGLDAIGKLGSTKDPENKTLILHYLRFVAYPAVMLLVAFVVQFKFAGGYSKLATTNKMPPRV